MFFLPSIDFLAIYEGNINVDNQTGVITPTTINQLMWLDVYRRHEEFFTYAGI